MVDLVKLATAVDSRSTFANFLNEYRKTIETQPEVWAYSDLAGSLEGWEASVRDDASHAEHIGELLPPSLAVSPAIRLTDTRAQPRK